MMVWPDRLEERTMRRLRLRFVVLGKSSKASRSKYRVFGFVAVALVTACSEDAQRKTVLDEDRTVPEAAAACGLNPRAVIRGLNRGPPTSLMIEPLYDNTTSDMAKAKECLVRWAAANGYLYVERESLEQG
jgi:hypothetical protein